MSFDSQPTAGGSALVTQGFPLNKLSAKPNWVGNTCTVSPAVHPRLLAPRVGSQAASDTIHPNLTHAAHCVHPGGRAERDLVLLEQRFAGVRSASAARLRDGLERPLHNTSKPARLPHGARLSLAALFRVHPPDTPAIDALAHSAWRLGPETRRAEDRAYLRRSLAGTV